MVDEGGFWLNNRFKECFSVFCFFINDCVVVLLHMSIRCRQIFILEIVLVIALHFKYFSPLSILWKLKHPNSKNHWHETGTDSISRFYFFDQRENPSPTWFTQFFLYSSFWLVTKYISVVKSECNMLHPCPVHFIWLVPYSLSISSAPNNWSSGARQAVFT